jgi:hypothetical protein
MKKLECPNCRYKGEESDFEYADETHCSLLCGRCLCEFKVSSGKITDPGYKIHFRNCDACRETLIEGDRSYGVVFGEMDYPDYGGFVADDMSHRSYGVVFGEMDYPDYGGFVADDMSPWDRVFHQQCWEELIAFALHHPENPARKI